MTDVPANAGAHQAARARVVSTGMNALGPADYLRVIYRRRWLVLFVFASVVLAVAAYTFTAQPIYQANTAVLIEVNEPNVVEFKKVLDEGLKYGDYYETQYELLRSRALAQRTVAALGLAKRPDTGNEAVAISAVRAGLRVVPVHGSRIVNVSFRSPDPQLAAEVANAHAQQYIQQSLDHQFKASKDATDWLDSQLAEERTRVQRAEAALQAYREEHDAVSLKEGQDIVVQKLADLNAAVTRAKTNRIAKEADYQELRAIQQRGAPLDSAPAILANSFVQQLKADLAGLQREQSQLSETLGDRHPTLLEKRSEIETTEKRLAAEVAKVADSIRNGFRAAQGEESSLTQALETQKREALALNRRGIEYSALEREAESVQQVYQSLMQRAKETSVSRDLPTTNIRIVDRAQTPKTPVFPRPRPYMVMGVLAGGLLALAVALGIEWIDDRIRTPDDIRRRLGLPCLGLVPELRGLQSGAAPLLQEDVTPKFVEAIRALRTGVIASASASRQQLIVVAGTREGEGKSLVASSLAIALAQARQQVLLIDADLRRPRVHRIFGVQSEPGLSNVLEGSAAFGEVLRPTTIDGLTIICAGGNSIQAPELLGSPQCKELFDILQEHFAWVIVDSPPVLHVTDATVISRMASGVVMVVGSGMTSGRAVRRAVDEVEALGGVMLGAVLNRADLDQHPLYFAPYARGEYRREAAPERTVPTLTRKRA